jgi:hypothetical protein
MPLEPHLVKWLEWLYATDWAAAIRENEYAFPWIECVHVLAITLVVGSISVVDLRLLGLASRDRSVRQVLHDVLPITWAAFGLALASGFLLFASNAPAYARNPFLQAKLGLLLLAGLNMALFHRWAHGRLQAWEASAVLPWRAKLAGAVSLLCWVGVVAAGRWIGFTMLSHS